MNKVLLWIKAVRAQFFTATAIPIFLGTAIAWNYKGEFNLGLFLLTLIGGIFIHGGLNFSNDYYDFKTGNDVVNKTPTPFSGGSRFLREGILKPSSVLAASLICFAVGAVIGLYLNNVCKGDVILIFGILGIFLAFFYTGGPVKIGYSRFAEASTGLGFGVLMVAGSYYVQTNELSWRIFLASLPIAILISLVQYINQFPDYEADKQTRKNNTVVRLGKAKAVGLYPFFLIFTYCLIVFEVVVGVFPPLALIALLTLPMAVKAIKVALKNFDKINELLPANALTIAIHFSVGMLLTTGFLLDKLIIRK